MVLLFFLWLIRAVRLRRPFMVEAYKNNNNVMAILGFDKNFLRIYEYVHSLDINNKSIIYVVWHKITCNFVIISFILLFSLLRIYEGL